MEIKAFFDEATFTLTYVVLDPATRDAVVIDPVLDFDPLSAQTSSASVDQVSEWVRDRGLHVHYVLETHAHADHLSGSQLLKHRFGAKVAIGERIREVQRTFKRIFDLPSAFADDGSQFDALLADGERLRAGSLEIEVIATPGHTPACVSYHIEDAVFTGDALFIEDYGTGRCDFPLGSATALYDSITERLYPLPAETRVFVGHDYQPDGRALRYETTIGVEKRANKQLRADTTREAYVHFRNERDATLKPPRLIYPSVQVNIDAGRLPAPRENGIRYLVLPLNTRVPTDEAGEALPEAAE